jgi:UDP-glucose 4-epimerase
MPEQLSNKRILITGGAGFIGSNLSESIVKHGAAVRVFDNLSTGHLSNLDTIKNDIEFIKGDIRDYDHLKQICKGIDIIFHEAAEVSVQKTFENPVETLSINATGTLNVFDVAKECGVNRVVQASSCAVYGDGPELPKVETMNPFPISFYAAQKIMAEYHAMLYHKLYQLETVSLRYFNVYGLRQDPSSTYSGVISIFLTKAIENEVPVIYGDGNQCRDFINVKDIVQANILAATRPGISGNVYNIGTEKVVSINELWTMICQQTGKNISPTYVTERPGDIQASVSNISKARHDLNFIPLISFEKGLMETLEWYVKSLK